MIEIVRSDSWLSGFTVSIPISHDGLTTCHELLTTKLTAKKWAPTSIGGFRGVGEITSI